MTDDFLSNSNYYNKGGLNGKPKEPRPIPPKGQSPDKEIIIDGIDVSKCAYECNGFCTINFEKSNIGMLDCKRCEHCPSCHFKQLKRKEQECEKLYIQLKTDEEYHKEEENTLRKIIKNKEERNIELYKENSKYKQALDEIEKLMPKFDTSDGCSYGDYDCENCSDLDEDIVCTYKLKKVIKGIINKVKEQ